MIRLFVVHIVKMDMFRSHRPAFLDSVPVSIQLIAVGSLVVLAVTIYSLSSVQKPLKGFPIAALPEKGLSPKQSWLHAGQETITKALKEHGGPFQVITGTGPKVGRIRVTSPDDRSLTTLRSSSPTASPTKFALMKRSTSPRRSKRSSSSTTPASMPTDKD